MESQWTRCTITVVLDLVRLLAFFKILKLFICLFVYCVLRLFIYRYGILLCPWMSGTGENYFTRSL
jgi:hypothetical protein